MEITQDKILEYLKKGSIALSKASDEEEEFMYNFLVQKGLMTLSHKGTALLNNEGQAFIGNAYYFNPVPLTVFDWRMNIIQQLKDGQAILKGNGELKDQALIELKQDGLVQQVGTSYQSTLTSRGRQLLASMNNPIEDIKISILKYLTEMKGKPAVVTIPNLENVDDRLFKLAINELTASGLIKNTVAGWKITDSGDDFLTRHEFGLKKEEKPFINIEHLGHKIRGDVHGSDLSIDISRDKQITNNNTTSPNTKKSVLEWCIIIIGLVASLIGIYWFFTK